jgi:integrase
MDSARRDGLIPDNPARGVTLPTVTPGREVFLTREQVDNVAKRMDPDDRTVLLVLAYTGLRWGELAGLHVRRLDLLRRQLDVVETLVEVKGRSIKPYPKGRQRRTVPLTDRVVDELAAFLARNPRGRDDLVFQVYRSTWGRRHLQPALRAAGAPIVRVHDLRHTYASWLVQDGMTLPEVALVLGHASITTTMRYAHLAPGALDRVRQTLEARSSAVNLPSAGSQRQPQPAPASPYAIER